MYLLRCLQIRSVVWDQLLNRTQRELQTLTSPTRRIIVRGRAIVA